VASKGRRYRTVVVEGYEVLIGKGDADNDELTFALAAPEDFWLHVAGGVPGSHVVVRNPDKLDALPRAVDERAAALAARHSKARDARRVDVHLCRVADVSKPRGAPPGQVELRRWERVRVHRDAGSNAAARRSDS
jgi:predicted ribosome quality control (RQC) complex YloA/Tae2 family protein